MCVTSSQRVLFPFIEIIDCLGTTYSVTVMVSPVILWKEKWLAWVKKNKNKKQNKQKHTGLVVPVIVYRQTKTKTQTKNDWLGGYRDCIKTKMTGLVVPVII